MNIIPRCLCWMVFLLNGCAHYYNPGPLRPLESIPEFSATGPVAISLGSVSAENQLILAAGIHKHYASLSQCTEVAVAILKRELTARGIQIVDSSDRSLKVSIESIKTEMTTWGIGTGITLRVETNDGYVGRYKGQNNSTIGMNLPRQIDGAIMRSVVDLLKDQKIIAYLGGHPQ